MKFQNWTMTDIVTRVVYLIAIIVIALDMFYWRP